VGFEFPHPDLVDFPEYMVPVMSRLTFRVPACVGEVAYRGLADAQADIDNLRAAIDGAGGPDAFMTAASPGVIAVFLANRYYGSHEEYLFALADAMKAEYDLIHGAGFVLQVDCPDLAMARHTWGDGTIGEFRERIRHHVDAINHATRDIPPERMRLHLCWGNYNGPHRHDVALREIIDIALLARPAAISFEAASTSGRSSRTSSCRTGRSSSPASWTRRPTTSSTRSSSPSGSCATRSSSAART
jgi:5-methyltetrahydropteroyltriglutamate--homocysteine methyltransferase